MDGMAGLAPKGADAAHPAGQYGAIAKLFHWVTLGLINAWGLRGEACHEAIFRPCNSKRSQVNRSR